MKICLLVLLSIIISCRCQRKITNGSAVDVDAGFVVYLIAAVQYVPEPVWPGWLCGGAVVHPAFIITSAACVTEVKNIYVISGYKKYIKPHFVHYDQCTKRTKRRITRFCTMVHHADTPNATTEGWMAMDIAIAKVNPVFDFYDANYLNYCSYLPTMAGVSFVRKYELPGRDAVVYGWGHAQFYRQDGDLNDYNEEYLQWTSTKIIDRNQCREMYQNVTVAKSSIRSDTDPDKSIERYAICTYGKGDYDASGKLLVPAMPTVHGCDTDRRSGDVKANSTSRNCTEIPSYNSTNISNSIDNTTTRRNGICQNDHGSPLITWIAGRPYVIGVATAYMVKKTMECGGPYIFTSVRANSRLVSCVLNSQKSRQKRRNLECDYQNIKITKVAEDDDDDDFPKKASIPDDPSFLYDTENQSALENLGHTTNQYNLDIPDDQIDLDSLDDITVI